MDHFDAILNGVLGVVLLIELAALFLLLAMVVG